MNVKEFRDQVLGGKHATLMACQVDGSPFNGRIYKKGDTIDVEASTALYLYNHQANMPDGTVANRWKVVGGTMTFEERVAMNRHLAKEHERETGEGPVQIKSRKNKK